MEQSFLHTLLSCLTNFLPDRCSTGPVGNHPLGLLVRTTNLPPCWPVRSYRALPECRYCPNWATTDTPRTPNYLRHLPARYSRTALSAHSLTIAYLQRCSGFHRIVVIGVRAFTVLLFYSYLNYTQTGITMDITNYPPNTITRHLYLELNNTLYSLTKTCIRLSQDRSNN